MRRLFSVALILIGSLAVCLAAAPSRLLAQAPAAGDTKTRASRLARVKRRPTPAPIPFLRIRVPFQ